MFDFESVEKELGVQFENVELKIVYLYYVEKYSIREVAKVLKCAPQTIGKELHRTYGVRSKEKALALRSTDAYREKLRVAQLGESNSLVKLTEGQVVEIRSVYDNIAVFRGAKYQAELKLAEKYKVSRSTIADIVKRRTWKHI